MVRFDKPCKQVSAAVKYFRTHMAKKDYLSQGGQVELTWVGEGAKQLGLSGDVRETEFARLCAGKHPVTNVKLAARENGPVKRVCYFGQISPPKDVSIAYLVGGDERIAGWWKEAVNDTVKEIEAVTAVRIRKGGVEDQDRYTNKMVAAILESQGDFKSVFTYLPDVSSDDFVSLTMPVRTESWKWDGPLHPIFQMHLTLRNLLVVTVPAFKHRRKSSAVVCLPCFFQNHGTR